MSIYDLKLGDVVLYELSSRVNIPTRWHVGMVIDIEPQPKRVVKIRWMLHSWHIDVDWRPTAVIDECTIQSPAKLSILTPEEITMRALSLQ